VRSFHGVCVLAIVTLLVGGCAALKERRTAQEEADAADAALTATADLDALLSIARARDARRDPATLHELARHAAPAVRAEALRAAGLVGDPTSAGLLQSGLGDSEPSVRAAAAFALSQVWGWYVADLERATLMAQAEEALLDAADEEEDNDVLVAIVRALGEVGGEPSEDVLWDLAGRDAPVGDAALLALAIRAKAKRTPPLNAARVGFLSARGGDEPVTWHAPYLASRAGFEPDAAGLGADWLQDLTPANGDAQAWRLRALGHAPEGHQALLMLDLHLRGGKARDRLACVRAAAKLGATAEPLLAVGLRDEEPATAVEAARAIGALGTPEARDRLLAWAPEATVARAGRLAALTPLIAAEDAEAAGPVVEAARAGLVDEAPEVRADAYGLLGAWPDPAAAEELLSHVEGETDATARIALALAISGREEPTVEGQLLAWLAGDDPLFGALGAMGLAAREEQHVTDRLLEAYDAFGDAPDWERRVEIVRALVPRGALPAERIGAFLQDPEPHVRLTAWALLVERVGRSKAGRAPQERELPDLADPWFGAGDVLEATVTTSRGDLKLVLWPHVAPAAVASFASLAEADRFDGLPFHRVVPDFVIQGGDPSGTGWGGPGYVLRDEFSPAPYVRGTLGMARSDKDTAGSQWFVTHSPQPHLDGHYTAFGQLISGFDVLDAVRVGDVIEDVTIRRRSR